MISVISTLGVLALCGQLHAAQPDANARPPEMSFFITSVGLGKGGDLGGLVGADAHCQALATAVDAGHLKWHAYLSTQGEGAVNVRDRIGKGPWANAKGVVMATNLDNLHYDNSNFTYEFILDEKGNNFESRIDGTAFPAAEADRTCNNWTSSTTGGAMVCHADRYSFAAPGSPWNT